MVRQTLMQGPVAPTTSWIHKALLQTKGYETTLYNSLVNKRIWIKRANPWVPHSLHKSNTISIANIPIDLPLKFYLYRPRSDFVPAPEHRTFCSHKSCPKDLITFRTSVCHVQFLFLLYYSQMFTCLTRGISISLILLPNVHMFNGGRASGDLP